MPHAKHTTIACIAITTIAVIVVAWVMAVRRTYWLWRQMQADDEKTGG